LGEGIQTHEEAEPQDNQGIKPPCMFDLWFKRFVLLGTKSKFNWGVQLHYV